MPLVVATGHRSDAPLSWLSSRRLSAYHETSINSHDLAVNFHETIQLKALELKQLHTRGMTDSLAEAFIAKAVDEGESTVTKNICAHVSKDLFDRVEQCCSMLSITKRRFVEMALSEALDRAETIVADVDPFPGEGDV